MKKIIQYVAIVTGIMVSGSCSPEETITPPITSPVDEFTYKIPVVVHIIHFGEPVGEGYNLPTDRVVSQIRVLNEDFRKKEGTLGYNTHPDGADARIEFVLAKVDPEGKPTTGIVRVNAAEKGEIVRFRDWEYYASLSYWNPEHYLNIWTEPMPDNLTDILLGEATGPQSDLPGAELFIPGEPVQPEGILINTAHFGITDLDSEYNLGRTLTHEAGHYLGLLHTWGTRECTTNDYCEDTPPVTKANATTTCDGSPVMKENYMTFSPDSLMNIFTKDQVVRMHYVLEHSPERKSLLNSPALHVP